MRNAGTYYVYILASRWYGTLYIGVTNNVRTRLEAASCRPWLPVCEAIRGISLGACRGVRIAARGDFARKAIEELAARLEDLVD